MCEGDTRLHSRLRGRVEGLTGRIALALFLAAAVCAPTWAAPAPKSAKPSILILPFDLFDFSLDQRPATVNALHKWVRELPREIRRDLRRGGRFRVIGDTGLRADLQKLEDTYDHPTTCRICMIELGRKAGADYVLVGQVRKLSNLITYFQGQVDDVRTGRMVHRIDSRADGADSNVMWRRIAHNLTSEIEHSAFATRPSRTHGTP